MKALITFLFYFKGKKCRIYNDPHFSTFGSTTFDVHTKCNYSFAQTGSSYEPKYGVFGSFKDCRNNKVTCVDKVTIRISKYTIVNVEIPRSKNDKFKIYVSSSST